MIRQKIENFFRIFSSENSYAGTYIGNEAHLQLYKKGEGNDHRYACYKVVGGKIKRKGRRIRPLTSKVVLIYHTGNVVDKHKTKIILYRDYKQVKKVITL